MSPVSPNIDIWPRVRLKLNPTAGIFIPSLIVGACFGRMIGIIMQYFERTMPHLSIFGGCEDGECVVPGLYAMVSQLSCAWSDYAASS